MSEYRQWVKFEVLQRVCEDGWGSQATSCSAAASSGLKRTVSAAFPADDVAKERCAKRRSAAASLVTEVWVCARLAFPDEPFVGRV